MHDTWHIIYIFIRFGFLNGRLMIYISIKLMKSSSQIKNYPKYIEILRLLTLKPLIFRLLHSFCFWLIDTKRSSFFSDPHHFYVLRHNFKWNLIKTLFRCGSLYFKIKFLALRDISSTWLQRMCNLYANQMLLSRQKFIMHTFQRNSLYLVKITPKIKRLMYQYFQS